MDFAKNLWRNFMGYAPDWYKAAIVIFMMFNVVLAMADPFLAGWAFVLEFIFTLMMALKCYPLQPGGLLALEAIVLGLAPPEKVYHTTAENFPVILLLMFMVAAIYFMKDALVFIFTGAILNVRSKAALSLIFLALGAFLSAFLDALTVVAVIMAVSLGFYEVYHRAASEKEDDDSHDHSDDSAVELAHREDLEEFRGFLRNILMHGAVGTALGGVATLVGEPQNLLIGHIMGWHFMEFFIRMAPVSFPTLAAGLATCYALEVFGVFGYGRKLPDRVREALTIFSRKGAEKRGKGDSVKITVQLLMGVVLIVSLAFHVAEVGLVGLALIILLTTLNGVIEEHQIGKAFSEALPFTALLVVFFAIVAVIQEQNLFSHVIQWTLSMEGRAQLAAFFAASGVLTAISDNVFVATIYITEAKKAFDAGLIGREQFNLVAVAINAGTNIPSVATPNGQAAFLFLLTSAVASLIRLSYFRMVVMAFPYTITMTAVCFLSVLFFL